MIFPIKIKRVILDPDPRLRAPNVDVDAPWEDLEPWVRKMFKVMYHTGVGVGMAAPQVGWNVRLIVLNPDNKARKPAAERVYWNPTIATLGEPEKKWEGCLSLPKVYGDVMRYPEVRLQAQSPTGPVDEIVKGYAAQILQHEVGHLNGELCWERFVK